MLSRQRSSAGKTLRQSSPMALLVTRGYCFHEPAQSRVPPAGGAIRVFAKLVPIIFDISTMPRPKQKRCTQNLVAHLKTPAGRPKHCNEDRFMHLNTPDASLRRLSQPFPAPILCQENGHVGIPNYGNTCFFSTVCQMMCVLWPVFQYNDELITGHESSCGCINCAFNATVTELMLRRRLPVPSQARPAIPAIAL